MTNITFTADIDGLKLACEIVNTWELNEGDLLLNNGALMICGAFEDEVTKYGKTPEYDSKGARWCEALVMRSSICAIPRSWLTRQEDGSKTWRVQGNTRANWSRIVSVENGTLQDVHNMIIEAQG